jgi:DNA polymerase III subunit epsilon
MLRPIYFDTETTGTRAGSDRIIELAAYDPVNKRSFSSLINPCMPIPQEATNIHKITDQMVQDAPTLKEVLTDFLEFCDGSIALVAHNLISFDLPFLRAECKRAAIELPSHWALVDSLIWARRYRKDLPRHSLQFLRNVYGFEENQAHRALDDVMILYQVFQTMIDDLTMEEVIARLPATNTAQNTSAQAAKPQEIALSLF